MTPPARLSAAIECLDRILGSANAEQVLTNWGRANRFAGSGDRHAIRDLVYDALRCRRSFAALGGADTGRGLILGGLRAEAVDPTQFFTGIAHAPAALTPAESGHVPSLLEALDCPDWLAPRLANSLGDTFAPVMLALRRRAPVFLRVNILRASLVTAQAALRDDGIATIPSPIAPTALEVTENARKIQGSRAYLTGLVDLQDAASQAVVAALPLTQGLRVLDYCAGGGGKALAIAARGVTPDAHDANKQRLRDLPQRAERAKAKINIVDNPSISAPYDLILTDVPCSGSGAWRRDPLGKWSLTESRLHELLALQSSILDRAAGLIAPHGTLAYATCSLLVDENESQVAAFLTRAPRWTLTLQQRFSPLTGGDGFFLALLTKD